MNATSSNDKFGQRLNHFYNFINKADAGKIGSAAIPEIYSYDHDEKELTLRFRFQDWMLNCNGVMHGGIVSLFMDSSMGWMACTWPEEEQLTPTPSISMNVTFLEPIFPCEHILVTVRIVALKSHIAYVRASLYNEAEPDKKLASAVGEYYRTKHPIQNLK